ncbi:MAG: FlgD immunoglobulin-like domain containing protein [Gemmatimonadota bacterium]
MRRACLLLILLLPRGLPAADGYTQTYTRVVVETAEHWRAWAGAVGAQVIEADGTVRPRFLRRSVNAVLDAAQYETVKAGGQIVRGGIAEVHSSPNEARYVMDGDPTTYWEPTRAASVINSWSLSIDLGRAVIAERVVVRFAEDGDPFLKFRVMLADGYGGTIGDREMSYFRVGQVTRPNKDQRVFSFDVPRLRPVAEGITGEVAQRVKIQALDSDGPRAEEVTVERYAQLGPSDRGDIEYLRRTVAGRLIEVTPEAYALLPQEEQGPVRYYRYERPRLAELEVYTPGDNVVALTQRLANRDMNIFDDILLFWTTDGFYTTGYHWGIYDALRKRWNLRVDLGARFWLDRVRLLSDSDPPLAYQLRLSDGSVDPSGELVWQTLDECQNRDSYLQLEETFPLQEVRYLDLRRLPSSLSDTVITDRAKINELQAYGEGYVSRAELTSPVMVLDRARVITAVEWDGEAPADTRLEIRTRSGDEMVRRVECYDYRGREVSEAEWNALNEDFRGEIIEHIEPGPNWSDWSEPYRVSGEPFRSPSPRLLMLAQVRLLTGNPQRHAWIRSLRLRLAAPLIERLLAEIWPADNVAPGVDQDFTLYLKPEPRPGDPGFDRLRIRSSAVAPIVPLSLRAGSDPDLRYGSARQLWPGEVVADTLEDGSLELVFPAPITGGDEVYALRFRTRVFLQGTTFSAEMSHAARPGVVQGAVRGNASELAPGQGLVVTADLSGTRLLQELRVEPPVFTPNGDGINDEATIRFSVYRIKAERVLTVTVHDLSGRRVRDLSLAPGAASGIHVLSWDGCDERGDRVAPGAYLLRVYVPADAGGTDTEAMRLVHVAY